MKTKAKIGKFGDGVIDPLTHNIVVNSVSTLIFYILLCTAYWVNWIP